MHVAVATSYELIPEETKQEEFKSILWKHHIQFYMYENVMKSVKSTMKQKDTPLITLVTKQKVHNKQTNIKTICKNSITEAYETHFNEQNLQQSISMKGHSLNDSLSYTFKTH